MHLFGLGEKEGGIDWWSSVTLDPKSENNSLECNLSGTLTLSFPVFHYDKQNSIVFFDHATRGLSKVCLFVCFCFGGEEIWKQ